MRKVLSITALLCGLLLAACGGSSDALRGGSTTGGTGSTGTGTGTGTGTTTTGVTTVSVVSSSATIAADGSNSATITATLSNAANNVVPNVTVTFAASAGSLVVTQATTNASGVATATLSAGSAATGTAITVTVTSGTVSGKATVTVGTTKQTIQLLTSASQIPSDGSKAATITALVRDANNNFVSGVAVNFVATSGGVAITQGTTDATGAAIGTLNIAGDPTNRVITVTATSGAGSATVDVAVTGTTLTVAGPPALSSGAQGTFTVTLLNSSSVAIPNQKVTLASSLGNTLSAGSVTTDATGKASFTVTANKAGSDTITGTALGLTSGQAVVISAQNFVFTTPASTTPLSPAPVDLIGTVNPANPINQPLTVTFTSNGSAVGNQTVNFATTRGTLSALSAPTNSAGQATVSISSTVAGPATVTASVAGAGLSAEASIDFIATVPASIDLQASPATIATQGQSTLTAVVRDANNNLVEGKTVTFETLGDTTGGTLSTAAAITDSQGRAQTVYTASSTPSATNGVVVQATVQGTTIVQTANLTVGGQTVFLSLGTGNKISENANQTQFLVPYTVEAVDAAGNPVANVAITLTVHPLHYFKGGYYKGLTAWTQTNTPATPPGSSPTSCPNEDANFNGVLDPGEDGCADNQTVAAPYFCNPFGNMNGKLDPGGTAVASPATQTTDSTGAINFNVIYPEDQAQWVQVQLIATATVQGTETTASTTFVLPILATYLTTLSSDPPGFISPYGTATSCTSAN